MPQSELEPDGWRFESPLAILLLEKLRRAGRPLGEYVKGRFYRGMVTGSNEAFVVDRVTRDALIKKDKSSAELLKPYLRGRDVKKWSVANPDLWVCYIGWDVSITKYPGIYSHIRRFEKELRARPEVNQGRVPWYALSRYASDYWQEFERPKILYQEIATYQGFAWDKSGSYVNNKLYLIPDAGFLLLAILNSKACWWFLGQTASKLQGGAYAMQTPYVSQIPIPAAHPAERAALEVLVDRILKAKGADVSAEVSVLEREIDQRVYALYGLTADEIKMVEEVAR
jgi:hypothetical protein